jgi:hypothetical protein
MDGLKNVLQSDRCAFPSETVLPPILKRPFVKARKLLLENLYFAIIWYLHRSICSHGVEILYVFDNFARMGAHDAAT